MDYFIYNRKSQEDEGRQVQSIDDQVKSNRELAGTARAMVKDNFTEAKSAKRPGRPVFNEMLDRIEAGEADGIIAWHPDRLSRNAVDAGRIIDLLDRKVLRDLKFCSYTFENTPEGKWMLGIVLGQAKYQNDKLSVDVLRGMRSKVDKGQAPRRAIAGYTNNRSERTYEADPGRFEMVQRGIRLVLGRIYNPRQALDVLNGEWGFTTFKTEKTGGKPLSVASWYRMLSNPVIAGQFMHDGLLCQGKQRPMLTALEFEQLQGIVHKVTTKPKRHYFAFNGFIRCGLCGCQVLGEKKVKRYTQSGTTREYTYYHCSGRRGCSRQSVSPEYVEGMVLRLLGRVTMPHESVNWCTDPIQAFHREESGFHKTTYDSLLNTLAGTRRKKSNLLDLRLSDPEAMTPDEFREENAKLQQEITELEGEIQCLTENAGQLDETVRNVFEFAANAEETFRLGNAEIRRYVAQLIGVKYVLTLEKLEIEPHPLLVPILAFEPPNIGSGSSISGCADLTFPQWCRLRENIRTLAEEGLLQFPKWDVGQSFAPGLGE